MVIHSSILVWGEMGKSGTDFPENGEIDRGAWRTTIHAVTSVGHNLVTKQKHTCVQFSPTLPSPPGCHTTLSRAPCAVH